MPGGDDELKTAGQVELVLSGDFDNELDRCGLPNKGAVTMLLLYEVPHSE